MALTRESGHVKIGIRRKRQITRFLKNRQLFFLFYPFACSEITLIAAFAVTSFRGEGKNDLQLNLTVYNINQGRNQEIMDHCRTLQEYSRFVAKMREHIRKAAGPLTEKELDKLLQECISEGILADFLKTHGTEVISMLFTEMTEEEARDLAREDGYERGRRDGQEEGTFIGDANASKRIARNMKVAGMDSGEIVKLTGLTLEEVLAL